MYCLPARTRVSSLMSSCSFSSDPEGHELLGRGAQVAWTALQPGHGEMKRVLEKKAKLIGQYEDKKNTWTDRERRFNSNQSSPNKVNSQKKGAQQYWSFPRVCLQLRNVIMCSLDPPKKHLFKLSK